MKQMKNLVQYLTITLWDELRLLIETEEYRKYWDLFKDKCDVCKDYELRMMCVDSRLPEIREDGTAYFVTECDYNPYISKWITDIDYLPLDESGVISDENGLIVDKDRLEGVINKLWQT